MDFVTGTGPRPGNRDQETFCRNPNARCLGPLNVLRIHTPQSCSVLNKVEARVRGSQPMVGGLVLASTATNVDLQLMLGFMRGKAVRISHKYRLYLGHGDL